MDKRLLYLYVGKVKDLKKDLAKQKARQEKSQLISAYFIAGKRKA